MKKIFASLLILTLTLFAFTSCGEKEKNDNTQIRVGFLSGPTGIGMAKLINDNGGLTGNEKYAFRSYAAEEQPTATAKAELLKGNVDVICLPTNEAAAYYNSTDDNSLVLAINTLNTLFFISDENNTINSLSDLEGKTIYTCENGTPKTVLEHLLESAEINATVSTNINGTNIGSPEHLKQQIIKGSVPIAFAPEPIVSASAFARTSSNKTPYSVDLRCDDVWNSNCDSTLAMGCIVASRSFVEAHPTVIDAFLKEYKASIEFASSSQNIDSAAEYVKNAGILPNLNVAKSAIQNLGSSIAYIDGSTMKTTLEAFYNEIGITPPDSQFYYEK